MRVRRGAESPSPTGLVAVGTTSRCFPATCNSHRRVTVTDHGGRPLDYQVVDRESNENGGMLVIATSIPDEREWIQWKGRTARQDRPGQFYVLLNKQALPFSEPKQKRLVDRLQVGSLANEEQRPSPSDRRSRLHSTAPAPRASRLTVSELPLSENAKISLLLEVADDGIDRKLKEFEHEQAIGEKLNELTEKYYKQFPRDFDEPWPSEQFYQTDVVLRRLLWDHTKTAPKEIRVVAKAELSIDLE